MFNNKTGDFLEAVSALEDNFTYGGARIIAARSSTHYIYPIWNCIFFMLKNTYILRQILREFPSDSKHTVTIIAARNGAVQRAYMSGVQGVQGNTQSFEHNI